MAGPYTSGVDERNNQELSTGATIGQANSLADMLLKKKQFEQQLAQPGKLAEQKSGLEAQAQQRELEQAKQVIEEQAKAGRSVNAKIGGVDINQKEDNPLKYMFRSQQQGAKALSHAYDTYMKAFPDVQKRAQSAQEGLEAINDPNQIGSIGQAKTLMIKNLGMNRYNQQEGNALVPPQLAGVVHQIFNFAGTGDNPLTSAQRQAMNTVFQGSLQTARKQHEMAKNNALGSYMNSGFADPGQAQQFKSTVGQDFDKQLNDITDKYKQVPVNQGYQPPTPGSSTAQPPSMVDKLKSMLHMGGQSQPQQVPQSAQQGGQQTQPSMSFDEFKKRKAAGQL